MQYPFKYTLIVILYGMGLLSTAQADFSNYSTRFTVRGSVIKQDTREGIPEVNIQINGRNYTNTDIFGDFKIEAKIGDEITVKHKDFETVYYTIQSPERITVEVILNDGLSVTYKQPSGKNTVVFNQFIDSAEFYLQKDAQKSIQFIGDALESSNSKKQNGEAYQVLGNIYMYWKQYDLAISNFGISLQSNLSTETRLKLAKAYLLNENYKKSKEEYQDINKTNISSYQLVTLYEGLGDVHKKMSMLDTAIKMYSNALKLAKKQKIETKIIDLNSKLGETYTKKGEPNNAEFYFSKSLVLANAQSKERAVEEKLKVADFKGENNLYESEIKLRKQVINDISKIEKNQNSSIDNDNAYTLQKQNYKIGNAYAKKSDYKNAINYLEKSKKEAETKKDLVVQKDATRTLSQLYKTTGNYTKALETYKDYVAVVDKLYIQKEQEISQAIRFRKNINLKQNRITSLENERELSRSKYLLTQEQSKRQKIAIYALVGSMLLLLVIAFLMYKYIRQQRFSNHLLALKSLRSQMNPHFIFNALNSVNSFIALSDERTANKYLTDFSKLMRVVLENSEQDFISLKKEIELLQLYTQLEHFRFQDKFSYTINVDKHVPVKDFKIPPMLLQPYIENAVWHGLRYKKEKGYLNVTISHKTENAIEISITDNGIGRKQSKALKTKNQKKHNSKGMDNIKKRVAILNVMYRDKIDIIVDNLNDEEEPGTKVVVTLKKD